MGATTVSGIFCWLSNDPIGIMGGLNQYAFVGDNPVNRVDPLGLVDLNLFPTNQLIYIYANATFLTNGSFSVGAHGNACMIVNATGAPLTASNLAGQILACPNYSAGQSVTLGSCNTGKKIWRWWNPFSWFRRPFASHLSGALTTQSGQPTIVIAPNTYLWFDNAGNMTPANMTGSGGMGAAGQWITFGAP